MESSRISQRSGGARHRRTDSHVQNADDQIGSHHDSSKRHEWQDPDDPNNTSSEDTVEDLSMRCQCSAGAAGAGAGAAGHDHSYHHGAAYHQQQRRRSNGPQNGLPTPTTTTFSPTALGPPAATAAAAHAAHAAHGTTSCTTDAAGAPAIRKSTVLLEELKRLDRGAAQIADEESAQFVEIGKLANDLLDWMGQGRTTAAGGTSTTNQRGGGGSGSGNGQHLGS